MISHAVKKTISLPADLAREAEEVARIEGKSLSVVVQEALRNARTARLMREFNDLQGYWSRIAQERGILSESDLRRYLKR
jgi:metal-responsive CopG/Arc/MetJ family transcriptional regulator